jgi:hypothetical protein
MKVDLVGGLVDFAGTNAGLLVERTPLAVLFAPKFGCGFSGEFEKDIILGSEMGAGLVVGRTVDLLIVGPLAIGLTVETRPEFVRGGAVLSWTGFDLVGDGLTSLAVLITFV